ncbi:MAG: 50S ribosomal protein L21 [Gammaproteobacteria bacterium]|nr:50S ribosomal protein L21 [Gammaproteobacteria bacterium]
MPALGCCLWWFLLGLLLGWLLNWLMARICRSMRGGGPAAPHGDGLYYSESASPAPDSALHRLVNTRFYPADRIEESHTPAAAGASAATDAPIDLAAARAAGFAPRGADDLTLVEGIGPKIAEVLRAGGITTFAQLAAAAPEALRGLLDAAGPSFKLAQPQSWPAQAALAAQNRWGDLKAYQDRLTVGRPAD